MLLYKVPLNNCLYSNSKKNGNYLFTIMELEKIMVHSIAKTISHLKLLHMSIFSMKNTCYVFKINS